MLVMKDIRPCKAKTVLLDMDGVVMDSMPYHIKSWTQAAREFGFFLDESELYLHEGAISLDGSKKVFENGSCKCNRDIFAQILDRQKEIFFAKFLDAVRPFDNVCDMLSLLNSRGKRLGLVTSSHQDILDMILPEYLQDFFDVVVTGDSIARPKPFPDPYINALERLSSNSEEAIVIENAPAGIKAAKASGCMCIAICTTLEPQHLQEAGADIVVRDHDELFNCLCLAV